MAVDMISIRELSMRLASGGRHVDVLTRVSLEVPETYEELMHAMHDTPTASHTPARPISPSRYGTWGMKVAVMASRGMVDAAENS